MERTEVSFNCRIIKRIEENKMDCRVIILNSGTFSFYACRFLKIPLK